MHPPISPSSGLRRVATTLLVTLTVLLASISGLQHWQLNEFAITPGLATDVPPLVSVHGLGASKHNDHIYLVDVYLQQLSVWQYLTMHMQKHVEFIPGAWLEQPGVPTSELIAQGYLQMVDSKMAAEVAALRALGVHLRPVRTGAVITAVTEHASAAGAGLRVADRIVAINGHPVRQSCDVIAVLHDLAPGSATTLRVVKQSFTATGVVQVGATTTVHVVTQGAPTGSQPQGCPGIAGVDRSIIGVALEDGLQYHVPGTIAIDTRSIGGPSAGLAMTLAILDKLSTHSLTGGHAIATTGTIDANGNIGEVGGVAQKTVAVANAGVRYFFVPTSEAAQARSAAPPSVHIIPVSTLAQVLHALRSLGGAAPRPIPALTKPIF